MLNYVMIASGKSKHRKVVYYAPSVFKKGQHIFYHIRIEYLQKNLGEVEGNLFIKLPLELIKNHVKALPIFKKDKEG